MTSNAKFPFPIDFTVHIEMYRLYEEGEVTQEDQLFFFSPTDLSQHDCDLHDGGTRVDGRDMRAHPRRRGSECQLRETESGSERSRRCGRRQRDRYRHHNRRSHNR
jgi:hypothetical protein